MGFPPLWRLRDSNSRPPACMAGALPAELSPLLLSLPVFSFVSYPACTALYLLNLPVPFFLLFWQPPALPHRLQCSTIGRLSLNSRVRDGYACLPKPYRHQNSFTVSLFPLSSECGPLFPLPLTLLLNSKTAIQPLLILSSLSLERR